MALVSAPILPRPKRHRLRRRSKPIALIEPNDMGTKLKLLFKLGISFIIEIHHRSLYHEGETDFDQPSDEMDPVSPLHHLQRLSSFKKSHEES